MYLFKYLIIKNKIFEGYLVFFGVGVFVVYVILFWVGGVNLLFILFFYFN